MARERPQEGDYSGSLKRLLAGVLIICLIGLFILWRIDSPRVERFRAQVVDKVVPSFDWAMAPVTATVNLMRDFRSYQRIYQQNQELRRELQQMKAWKEAALQLEQENARLLDLNNVQLDPRLTFVTGVVLADSGSPFRQSVLINVGARDGIVDGWAAMDGLGLVGRISGVGERTSRVILLTDTSSRIPVTIEPSGQQALLSGDNSPAPVISFLEAADQVRPGDRVVASGDGGCSRRGCMSVAWRATPAGGCACGCRPITSGLNSCACSETGARNRSPNPAGRSIRRGHDPSPWARIRTSPAKPPTKRRRRPPMVERGAAHLWVDAGAVPGALRGLDVPAADAARHPAARLGRPRPDRRPDPGLEPETPRICAPPADRGGDAVVRPAVSAPAGACGRRWC